MQLRLRRAECQQFDYFSQSLLGFLMLDQFFMLRELNNFHALSLCLIEIIFDEGYAMILFLMGSSWFSEGYWFYFMVWWYQFLIIDLFNRVNWFIDYRLLMILKIFEGGTLYYYKKLFYKAKRKTILFFMQNLQNGNFFNGANI